METKTAASVASSANGNSMDRPRQTRCTRAGRCALLLGFAALTCLAVAMASDRRMDPPALKPLVDQIREDHAEARAKVAQEYSKRVSPIIERHEKVRARIVQKAGESAIARLEKLAADARSQGSEAGAALARQAIEKVREGMTRRPAPPDLSKLAVTDKDHHYLVVLAPVTWKQARAACQAMGGHLVCIETAEERDFLRGVFYTSGVRLWVGATDQHREGDWRWINDEPVSKRAWLYRQPDNWGRREHYAEVGWRGWRLNDAANDAPEVRGFICEWE